ncbi:hypothetical protein CEB3_c06860 [Peptococcaceae bacterium CEB3]|nr:hypothetical protein CEB3_c06860 [Peptococcaceae bacterium CEB3]
MSVFGYIGPLTAIGMLLISGVIKILIPVILVIYILRKFIKR